MQTINLNGVILEMFREIRSYSGDFGDGVIGGLANPFGELTREDLTEFERLGMSIAILVYLQTHVDNATYDVALTDEQAFNAISLLESGNFTAQKEVVEALKKFFESEESFNRSLKKVYEGVVLPFLERIDVSA